MLEGFKRRIINVPDDAARDRFIEMFG